MDKCQHGNSAPLSVLKKLHWSQAGAGRHKCTTCAYQKGFEAGSNEKALLASLFKNRLSRLVDPTKQSKVQPGNLDIVSPPLYVKSTGTNSPSFKAKKLLDRSYREHKNIQLGKAGELLVLDYECKSLIACGQKKLASQVVHVSEEEGDGAGYDIKSYRPDGKIKYIEVKTTRYPVLTPFFITYTELEFSKQNPAEYYLYRVYEFDLVSNSGKSYIIQGKVDGPFNLSPIVFKASRR